MADISAPSWGLVCWLALILGVLTYCDKILGYSANEFFKTIFSEAKDLTQLNLTRGAINFFGLIVVSCLAFLLIFSENAIYLFNIQNVINATADEQKLWVGVGLLFFVFFKSTICVALVK